MWVGSNHDRFACIGLRPLLRVPTEGCDSTMFMTTIVLCCLLTAFDTQFAPQAKVASTPAVSYRSCSIS